MGKDNCNFDILRRVNCDFDKNSVNKYVISVGTYKKDENLESNLILFNKKKYSAQAFKALCLNIITEIPNNPDALVSKEEFLNYFYYIITNKYDLFCINFPSYEDIDNKNLFYYIFINLDIFDSPQYYCELLSNKIYSKEELDILNIEAHINVCTPITYDDVALKRVSHYLIDNK